MHTKYNYLLRIALRNVFIYNRNIICHKKQKDTTTGLFTTQHTGKQSVRF